MSHGKPMNSQWLDNQYTTDPAVLIPHGASIGALFATMMGWLPAFVALVPAIYYLILIWETKTVQRWLNCYRARKRRRLRRKLAQAKKSH